MMRILFCNIAWMKEYRGNEDGKDTPLNGGSYVKIKECFYSKTITEMYELLLVKLLCFLLIIKTTQWENTK